MVNFHATKYGVIGGNLLHSLAAEVHNQFFDAYALDGIYEKIDFSSDKLNKKSFKKILSQYKGVNISAPYKEMAIKCVDFASDRAKYIGSINTVNNVNGKLFGYNTDVEGFKGLLQFHNISPVGKRFVILGAGGTAKSVIFYLKKYAKVIYVASRDEKTQIDGALTISFNELENIEADILVNATPVGMYPNINDCVVEDNIISKFEYVIDLIYNPIFSELLKRGVKLGKKCISGLYMLVSQAMQSESYWQSVDMEPMVKRVYSQINILEKKKVNANVYIIGMMGCGKTELSKALAKQSGREFIELDEYIEKISNKTIEQLYSEGENEFRIWEEKAIIQVAQMTNKVVALGCGTVLRERNLLTLKLSGIVVLRDRPLDKILQTIDLKGRQGVKSKDDVIRLHVERYHLYVALCDYLLPYGEIELDVKKMLELLR